MMAGRYQKQTVDYFPHYVDHGRVLYIMESTWGVEGYAAFYKLLEVLGKAEGHYFSAGDYEGREYLAAKMGVSAEKGQEMLCKLSKMGVIDSELWENAKVIWMQTFTDSIRDVYRKRTIPVPEKPPIDLFLPPEIGDSSISGAGNAGSKVKQSKVKNINNPLSDPPNPTPQQGEEKKPPRGKKKYSEEDPEYVLSNVLLQKIKDRNPNIKQPDLQSWARHIDLMLRIDKRTPEEIRAVIGFCQKDPFWQNNILSTLKLREKFDQLFMKMKGNGNDAKQNGAGKAKSDGAEYPVDHEY
jgi:hypothetical protein